MRRLLSLVAAVATVAGAAGCTEQLEGGTSCPALCPQTEIVLRDTIIEAVVVDSSIAGYPPLGFEDQLLLANRGDSLDTRVIVRFDSVPNTYRRPDATTDSTLARVDSATLNVRLAYPLADTVNAFTIDAYDVDTTVAGDPLADTVVATLRPLFRASRLLGSLTVAPSAIKDSVVRIPISNAAVLARAVEGKPLRIGLAVRGAGSVALTLVGQGSQTDLALRFRASADTTVAAVLVPLRSRTPVDGFITAALADYQVVFRSSGVPAGVLAVGGVPAHRTYLRFELPRRIVDSSRVVRASLLLTQIANVASAQRGDTVSLAPEVLTASEALTDLRRALEFTSPTFAFSGGVATLGSQGLVPNAAGVRTIEIAPLVQAWAVSARDSVPRAIVLRIANEGRTGQTLLFHSREATAPSLRPRVRLTYAPSLELGLP